MKSHIILSRIALAAIIIVSSLTPFPATAMDDGILLLDDAQLESSDTDNFDTDTGFLTSSDTIAKDVLVDISNKDQFGVYYYDSTSVIKDRAVLIIAQYDAKNRLITLNTADVSPGLPKELYTARNAACAFCKAYIWDGDFVPLANALSLQADIEAAPTIVDAKIITEVLDWGETVTAVRLEYSEAINCTAVEDSNEHPGKITYKIVNDRSIKNIYVNNSGKKDEAGLFGKYVFLNLGIKNEDAMTYRDQITFNEDAHVRDTLSAFYIFQQQPVVTRFGNVVDPVRIQTNGEIRLIMDDFQTFTYTNPELGTLNYHLYIPPGYETKSGSLPDLPLIVHYPAGDYSYNDSLGLRGALYSHPDVLFWASEESQAANKAFVVTVGGSRFSDWGSEYESSAMQKLYVEIINKIKSDYNVDDQRLYCISLAAGSTSMWRTMLANPDLFAAQISTAYDPYHTWRSLDLGLQNFEKMLDIAPGWFFAGYTDYSGAGCLGAADTRSKGERLRDAAMLAANDGYGIDIGYGSGGERMWDGMLRGESAEALASAQLNRARQAGVQNLVTLFIPNSITQTMHWSWNAAYSNAVVRNWLFEQRKGTGTPKISNPPIPVVDDLMSKLSSNPQNATLLNARLVTEVLEWGETVTAVRLEYSEEINSTAIEHSNEHPGKITYKLVNDRSIKNIYVNNSGKKDDVELFGKYVFLNLGTVNEDVKTYRDQIVFNENENTRDGALIACLVFQQQPIVTRSGNIIDVTRATTNGVVSVLMDDFKTFTYTNPGLGTLNYHLYIPAGYDTKNSSLSDLPLIVHYPAGDYSYNDSLGFRGALYSHPDALYWAAEESQAANKAFVVTVGGSRSSDWGSEYENSTMQKLYVEIINKIKNDYNVDDERIYCISLAGGSTSMWRTILANPDLFAAQISTAYDPYHTWRSLDLGLQNFEKMLAIAPGWFFAGYTDYSGAGCLGAADTRSKGERLRDAAILAANDGYGIDIAYGVGGERMWDGMLRGKSAEALAAEQLDRARQAGVQSMVTLYIPNSIPQTMHWSWNATYSNAAVRNWLFEQRKGVNTPMVINPPTPVADDLMFEPLSNPPGGATLLNAKIVTEVPPWIGEMVTAVRLEYSEEIDSRSIEHSNEHPGKITYEIVNDRSIKNIYVNNSGKKGDVELYGKYVFLDLGVKNESALTYREKVTFNGEARVRNALDSFFIFQQQPVITRQGNTVNPVRVETNGEIRIAIDDFTTFTYTNPELGTLNYHLYIPPGYEVKNSTLADLPLVVHYPSGDYYNTDSVGLRGTLFMHLDATSWASEESQAANKSFVVTVGGERFTDWASEFESSTMQKLYVEIINKIKNDYNIDDQRIYCISLAAGSTSMWRTMLANPDLFAAQISTSYDPYHTWQNLDLGLQNFEKMLDIAPGWFFAGYTDASGSGSLGAADIRVKGERLRDVAILAANDGYGIDIGYGSSGELMWDGMLRGAAAEAMAAAQINRARQAGVRNMITLYIPNSIQASMHWSWNATYSNAAVRNWLFEQRKGVGTAKVSNPPAQVTDDLMSAESANPQNASLLNAKIVTEVLDWGETVTSVRLEYSEEINCTAINDSYDNPAKVSFEIVNDRTIKRIYVNNTGKKGDIGLYGRYVFLDLGVKNEDAMTYRDQITFNEDARVRNTLSAFYIFQQQPIITRLGNVAAPVRVQTNGEIRLIMDDFETFTYANPGLGTLNYHLYIPPGYETKNGSLPDLPLVVHYPAGDYSYNDSLGLRGALYSHPDVLFWASEESQAANKAFVVTVGGSRFSDWGSEYENSSMQKLYVEIINKIKSDYNIDGRRVYCISLAGGSTSMWQTMLANPDLFAAQISTAYDPYHTWRNLDLGLQNYEKMLDIAPGWFFAGFTDYSGAGCLGSADTRSKGERLRDIAILAANDGYGIDIGYGADGERMWNGMLRGIPAEALAKAQLDRAHQDGATNMVTLFIPNSITQTMHWSWNAAYSNAVVRDWLFKQQKN